SFVAANIKLAARPKGDEPCNRQDVKCSRVQMLAFHHIHVLSCVHAEGHQLRGDFFVGHNSFTFLCLSQVLCARCAPSLFLSSERRTGRLPVCARNETMAAWICSPVSVQPRWSRSVMTACLKSWCRATAALSSPRWCASS